MGSSHDDAVHSFLLAALERPPGDRAAFLERTCRNPAIREKVDTLLSVDDRLLQALDQPWFDLPGVDKDPPISPNGPRIAEASLSRKPDVQESWCGPYRLLSEIGRGGMGSVFVATRDDQDFRRLVAIKTLHPVYACDDLANRFRAERQILARLEHSNIARLYDSGCREDGSPYFVMEYVEGLPMDVYCWQRLNTLEQRLDLFCQVCTAVAYAHQQLIVHRDIKPNNILVTDEGIPKLLDFGIAKLLVEEGSTAAQTRTQLRACTPAYASPEQIQGGPISAGVDVYSLGVLLYRILTEELPHPENVEQRISLLHREIEPTRPSTLILQRINADADRATNKKLKRLARTLRGDLDSIVLTSLRQRPEERYRSVDELGEEIRRFMAGEPVRARAGNTEYRARKFIRRHRLAVAAGTFLLVALIAVAWGFAERARRLATERDQITEERDRAQQVATYLADMLKFSSQGSTPVREVLDLGVRRARLEMHDDPVQEAMVLDTLGAVYVDLDLLEEAEPILVRGLALRSTDGRQIHDIDVGESLHNLADLAYRRGRLEEASRQLDRALELDIQALGQEHPRIAGHLELLGWVRLAAGDFDKAEELVRRAYEMRRRIQSDAHPRVGDALRSLGILQLRRGRLAEAEPLIRKVLNQRQRLYGEHHPEVASLQIDLALFHHLSGEPEAVEPLCREALATLDDFFPSPSPAHMMAFNLLGQSLHMLGRLTEAREVLHRMVHLGRQAHPEGNRDLAAGLSSLGFLYKLSGEYRSAAKLLDEALDIRLRLYGPTHPTVLEVQGNLALLHHELGNLELAEQLYQRCLRHARVLDRTPEAAYPRTGYADLLIDLGQFQAAEELLHQAADLLTETHPPDHWRHAWVEALLGASLAGQGFLESAAPALLEGFEKLRTKRPDDHQRLERIARRIAQLYDRWGKSNEARSYRQLAVNLSSTG